MSDTERVTAEAETVEVETTPNGKPEVAVTAVPKEKSGPKDPDSELVVQTKGDTRLKSAMLVLCGVAIGIIMASLMLSMMWGTIFQNAAAAL